MFTRWELVSQRIENSAWWNAVNSTMLADAFVGKLLYTAHGDMALTGDDQIDAWVTVFSQSNSTNDFIRNSFFTEAHQLSLHGAINDNMNLLSHESSDEQLFIEHVVQNVDMWAIRRDNLSVDRRGFDVDAELMSSFLTFYYGLDYPHPNSEDDAVYRGSISADEYESMVIGNEIGLDSIYWQPGDRTLTPPG